MKRRQWLTAGVAAAAGLAGAGWAWWRLQPHGGSASAADPAVQTLWAQPWTDPQGQAVVLPAWSAGPVLLNFWATWCPPCVEELPLLDAFYRQQQPKGLQVVGLAVDQPSSVREFLARKPLAFPVVMAGLAGTELSKQLGNANGGLPFSVLLDRSGRIVQRQIGRLHEEDLARWAQVL